MSNAFLLRRWRWLRNSMRLKRCKKIGFAIDLELFCCGMRSILMRCLFFTQRLKHLQVVTIGIFIGWIARVLPHRTDGDLWRVMGRTRNTRNIINSKSDLDDAVLLESLVGTAVVGELALAGLEHDTSTLTYKLPHRQDGLADIGDLGVDCRTAQVGENTSGDEAAIVGDGVALRILHGPRGDVGVEAKLFREVVAASVDLGAGAEPQVDETAGRLGDGNNVMKLMCSFVLLVPPRSLGRWYAPPNSWFSGTVCRWSVIT